MFYENDDGECADIEVHYGDLKGDGVARNLMKEIFGALCEFGALSEVQEDITKTKL